MRAAIYSRLARETGSSSLARQRSSCEDFCAARAWTIVGHYVDNDVSAYRVGVRRPEFERLLEDVSAGAIDIVVVFKIDRLVRRPFDFERFWGEAELRGTNLASVSEPVDSSTPHGVAFIRILVALAGLESATTGLRIVSLRREEARSGKAGPGSAYGFAEDLADPRQIARTRRSCSVNRLESRPPDREQPARPARCRRRLVPSGSAV